MKEKLNNNRFIPILYFLMALLITGLACSEGTERKAVETAVAGANEGLDGSIEQAEPTKPPKPTSTPAPTPTKILGLIKIGTHIVGKDIQPGIYWGLAGEDLLGSCYWARLSDLTGEMGSLKANDNAIGQYYIEIKESDFALETRCELIQLQHAPQVEVGNVLEPGTYLVGRDIQPGTYHGQAGEDILNSCYWSRLNDVSGGMQSIISNDNAMGSFYVQVLEKDFALKTACPLELVGD